MSTCIQMCSRSNDETECDSSRVLLCVADIMENDLPSDVSISVKNDFLLVVLSNKCRVTHVKINIFLVIESIIVNKHDKELTSVLINMITSLQVCLTLFRKSTFYGRTHFFKGVRKKAFAWNRLTIDLPIKFYYKTFIELFYLNFLHTNVHFLLKNLLQAV